MKDYSQALDPIPRGFGTEAPPRSFLSRDAHRPVTRKKAMANPSPIIGTTHGPDKKGRFWVNLPSGKPLLFHSGLPGELVEVRRGRRGRRGEQGDLLQVLESDRCRREARCAHFGVCGGCTMQQLPEDAALALKTADIYQHLLRSFPQAIPHCPVASPESFAYRTKIELSFLRESDGLTKLGFHRRGRFDKLVNLGRCWLSTLPPSAVQGLREWAHQHGLVGWDPKRSAGDLRYLIYRKASWCEDNLAALVIQTTATLTDQARADLIACLKGGGIRGAVLLWQSSVAGAVVPEREEPLYGPQTLIERLGPLEFELSWKSFYQVNPRAYQRLLDAMKSWRSTPVGGRILDLFCGVGSIGMYLARPEDRLTGVELVEQAVLDARANALRNGIEATFEVRSAEEWEALECDLLLLDPPRSGCHPKLLRVLAERAPAPELFYVCCNHHRLLEELPELKRSYDLVQFQAFDFFPQTHHLELLLQFRAR